MIEKLLKDASIAIMANNVWICFDKKPNLQDVAEARRLLDQLTDELIKENMK